MSEDLARCEVAVVGAGIAGLTAADALSRAGITVVVFEARDRVGGRAHSARAWTGTVELGASWFWPNEPLTRSLTDELGLTTFPQHLHGDALFETDRSGARRLDGNPVDVPAYRFAQGAQALAERMADRLPRGRLRLGDPVSAITLSTEGVRVGADSTELLADQVIVALPPALAVEQIAFAPDLPVDLRATAGTTAVWMGSIVKAVAVYDLAFWRAEQLSGSAISHLGPFREFHDHSGPDTGPAAIFGFAPAEYFAAAGTRGIEESLIEQLSRLFGPLAAHPAEVRVLDWSREPRTVPERALRSASTATFGAPVFQQPVHGRIHLASTETATACAGHIEGAIRAGRDAARRIRDRVGR